MTAVQRIESQPEIDHAQAVLDAFGGNALSALRSVIADAEHLCEQLEVASGLLSHGAGRGWTPSFSRLDVESD